MAMKYKNCCTKYFLRKNYKENIQVSLCDRVRMLKHCVLHSQRLSNTFTSSTKLHLIKHHGINVLRVYVTVYFNSHPEGSTLSSLQIFSANLRMKFWSILCIQHLSFSIYLYLQV